MRKTANHPNVPPGPEEPNTGDEAQRKTAREETEEILPAPATTEQQRIAEAWQHPPGQSSG